MSRLEAECSWKCIRTASRIVLFLLAALQYSSGLRAADSSDEHASHHPGQAGGATNTTGAPAFTDPMTTGAPAPSGGMAAGGGMMEQMGEMMKGMGKPPTKELYPALMALPELTLEKRQEVEKQAAERMHAGTLLMEQALDTLNAGALSDDYVVMHEAMLRLREGAAQLESGIAARRALAEGRAPRAVALAWFKNELNLPIGDTSVVNNHFGGARFHYIVIALLTAFAVAMIAMYFFKMKRSHELLARLAGGGAPAGSAPGNGSTPVPTGPSSPAGTKAPDPSVSAATTAKPAVAAEITPTNPPPQVAAPGAKALPAAAAPVGPVSSGWKGILRVNRIFEETPGVRTFRFTAMDGGPIPFTYLPGQYLIVFPMIDGRRTPRSYTMASSPTQRHFCELTIKREADGHGVSRYLHDGLQEGELLEASGPVGKFTFSGTEAKNIVLIGGGVGITPLMSYVRYLTDIGWPGDIFLLYTFRHASDYIFGPELERLCARHPKLHLIVTVTRPNDEPWNGLTGHLTKDLISRSVPDIATRLVYVCGPDTMMRATQAALLELEVPADHVKTEAFSAPQSSSSEDVKPPEAAAKSSPKGSEVIAPVAAPETKPADASIKPPEAEAAPTATEPPPIATDKATTEPAVNVTFSKSGKNAPFPPGKTVLEASEDVGVNIPFECRVGTCGKCKVHLLSGEVTMEVEDSLSTKEKSDGIILACQAKSSSAVAVDA